MRRRDWWLGVLAIVLAVLVHGLVPRYDFRQAKEAAFVRIDRWTGSASLGWWDEHRQWTAAPRQAQSKTTSNTSAPALPPNGVELPEPR
jgi:hypothetical protein